MTKLVPLKNVRKEFPDWPFSQHSTWRLIDKGKLGCVRVGRAIFLTTGIIEDFIAKQTAAAAE